jgi:pimeloyl-ACP methyl ester carboxylesterase
MRWIGVTGAEARPIRELTYLGLKHFRMPVETLRVLPVLFPEKRLRAMRVPTLLLIGDREVVVQPVAAVTRARQLFSNVQAELIPNSSHEMCFSQRGLVDARVRQFLNTAPTKKAESRVLVSASPVAERLGCLAV